MVERPGTLGVQDRGWRIASKAEPFECGSSSSRRAPTRRSGSVPSADDCSPTTVLWRVNSNASPTVAVMGVAVPADVRRQLLRLNASRVDQEAPIPTEDPFQKPRMKQERARARHRTNK